MGLRALPPQLSPVSVGVVGLGWAPMSQIKTLKGGDPGEDFSVLGLIEGGLQAPEQWGTLSPASQALRKMETANSDRGRNDVERTLPRNPPPCDADSSADHPLLCAGREGGCWGSLGSSLPVLLPPRT